MRCHDHGSKYRFEHTRIDEQTGFCFAAMSKRYVHLLPNEETKSGGMRGWETVYEILDTTYKWDPSVSSARSLRARAITLQESGGHADIVTVGDKNGRVEPIFDASAPGGRPKGMSTPGDGDCVAAPIRATA